MKTRSLGTALGYRMAYSGALRELLDVTEMTDQSVRAAGKFFAAEVQKIRGDQR